MNIKQSQQWKNLIEHLNNDLIDLNIADLFKSKSSLSDHWTLNNSKPINQTRFNSFSLELDQLSIDFSKQKITPKTIELLLELSESVNIFSAIDSLAKGSKVNTTENRAALHTALRLPKDKKLNIGDEDINIAIQKELNNMEDMVNKITTGHWRGFSGKKITDVVNLGVGGSDLGPLLVCHALDDFDNESTKSLETQAREFIDVHFVSTMDGSQLSLLFDNLNPETTLFIMVSKSFTTVDTLSNAASAKTWLLNACPDEKLITKQHFIGISTDPDKMEAWGIAPLHQLKLWDWVGGRFSLWSTVGLSIAVKIGMSNFRELLKGANALDEHFFNTKTQQNIPLILGLIGVWNTNFLDIGTHAILPYDARLKYFPDYLTQLEMESNGKSVTHNGDKIDYNSCPVLLGEVGPNAQHAFYQLLHQGTRKVSSDFIAPIKRFDVISNSREQSLNEQHLLTLANCFAQSRALMLGGSSDIKGLSTEKLSNHKQYPGNQPSTTILIKKLSPYSLGQLIALYEHKVFVMATIWGINPFDQWGVELGKVMAKETHSEFNSNENTTCFDDSTNGLINWIKNN